MFLHFGKSKATQKLIWGVNSPMTQNPLKTQDSFRRLGSIHRGLLGVSMFEGPSVGFPQTPQHPLKTQSRERNLQFASLKTPSEPPQIPLNGGKLTYDSNPPSESPLSAGAPACGSKPLGSAPTASAKPPSLSRFARTGFRVFGEPKRTKTWAVPSPPGEVVPFCFGGGRGGGVHWEAKGDL